MRKPVRERRARQVREDLPVRERAVDRGVHRAEVLLPLRRVDRRARELAVGQRDAEAARRLGQADEELGADLVAEAARAAVDRHDDLVLAQAVGARRARVVDALDALHFEVVVAGPERSHLAALPLLGERRHVARPRAVDAAAFLDELEVVDDAEALLHRPARAAEHHAVERLGVEPDVAFDAHARGNVAQQRVAEQVALGDDFVGRQVGAQAADAARDVEADAARADDAAALGVEGRDAADRESVAPVRIGHRERRADQPRQARDVRDLLEHLVVHRGEQRAAAVEPRLVARVVGGATDVPGPVVDAAQVRKVHGRFRSTGRRRSALPSGRRRGRRAAPSASRPSPAVPRSSPGCHGSPRALPRQ